MRPFLIALAAGVTVTALWWWLDDEEPAVTTPASAHASAPLPPPCSKPGPVTLRDQVGDASLQRASDDNDDEGPRTPVLEVTDQQLEQTLTANAAFAKANVGRFCQLADQLAKEPLFKPMQGSRDATGELSRLFGVTNIEEQRLITLPTEVRSSLMTGTGLELTAQQLNQVDFAWMPRLRDFDRLTGQLETHDPTLLRAYSPEPKFPFYFVRLRLLRAAKIGDWECATKDIAAFATLLHTRGSPRVEAHATGMIDLELKTLAQLKATGVEVPNLPMPSEQKVLLHRSLVRDAFRFVAPRVDPAVQRQAFECAKRAGFECVATFESASMAMSLQRLTKGPTPALDGAGCNTYQLEALRLQEPSSEASESARLSAPSMLFEDIRAPSPPLR